jgi:hypothetical protein
MAIEIEFSDGYGVTHPAAYARVQKVIIENPEGGQKKNVTAEVCIYASKAAYDAGKTPVRGAHGLLVQQPVDGIQLAPKGKGINRLLMECAVDPDAVTVADVYTWMKTQDAYKTSKDVYEERKDVAA